MTTTNNTSLFIPRVFTSVSEVTIRKVIEQDHGLGVVETIDMIPKKGDDGKTYNSIYIHMSSWSADEKTSKFLEHLKDTTKKTQLVYDEPWFWIVLENTSAKKNAAPNKIPKKTLLQKKKVDPAAPPNSPEVGRKQQAKTPDAPRKAAKLSSILTDAESIRNLEQCDFAGDDDTMNLVDADYVYYLEQDNTQLRNSGAWLQQQNFGMQKEIERLRAMMHSMVSGGMM